MTTSRRRPIRLLTPPAPRGVRLLHPDGSSTEVSVAYVGLDSEQGLHTWAVVEPIREGDSLHVDVMPGRTAMAFKRVPDRARRPVFHRTHEWFPDLPASEFLPVRDVCLKCTAERYRPPWGECLGGHPLADHYDGTGEAREVEGCLGPY